MSRCTCPACSEIFSGESIFDMHRRGEYNRNGRPGSQHPTNPRRCLTPAEMLSRGMVQVHGVWMSRLRIKIAS